MGRPKGNEKLWRGRPCNTQCSHENQKVKNGWFQKDEQGDIFEDARFGPSHCGQRPRPVPAPLTAHPLVQANVVV